MSCITKILKLKGDKEVMICANKDGNSWGNPWIAVEGGGQYKDYEYLIVLNILGYRCGYVAIPPEHKYSDIHLKNYDYDSLGIQCHGGLTFMSPYHRLKDLLSTPYTDQWIGFDCGHCDDMSDYDAIEKYFGKEYRENKLKYCSRDNGREVRTYSYVEQQCYLIIDQLIEI